MLSGVCGMRAAVPFLVHHGMIYVPAGYGMVRPPCDLTIRILPASQTLSTRLIFDDANGSASPWRLMHAPQAMPAPNTAVVSS